MDFYHALQCVAMQAVLNPDRDAWLRHVVRWYSKTFHTPIADVEQLPMDEVLLAYYESSFEEMEDDEREEHVHKLLETDEQRAARERLEAKAEEAGDELFDKLNKQVQEDVEKGKLAPKYEPKKRGLAKAKMAKLAGLKQAPKMSTKDEPVSPQGEEVSVMKFDNEGNLSSGDSFADPKKKV